MPFESVLKRFSTVDKRTVAIENSQTLNPAPTIQQYVDNLRSKFEVVRKLALNNLSKSQKKKKMKNHYDEHSQHR